MSARNKRGAKFKRRQQRELKGLPRPEKPAAYLDLVKYVEGRWGVSRTQARTWLLTGKINVNGEVWAYPHVDKGIIQLDELGRLRIMVEGVEDPRPASGGLVIGA